MLNERKSGSTESVRVLLIEDDPRWQKILRGDIKRALEGINCTDDVHTIADFDEALETLEKDSDWQLLIVDIGLGDEAESMEKYGIQVIRRARSKGLECIAITTLPAHVVTREDVTEVIVKLKARNFFYKKNYDPDEFMSDIRKTIELTRPQERRHVFISYSRKDREWLEKLKTCLAPLVRRNIIKVWDDSKIKPGSKWREEIKKALDSAKVAILLVSDNFLASEYIAEHELPPLLKAAEKKGLKVLWVAVNACLYEETEIEGYQPVNDPAKPLNSLSPSALSKEMVNICREIKKAATGV